MKYEIIFTEGFDDLEVQMRELSGCVIVRDDKGQYYYTMIVTFDTLWGETEMDDKSYGSTVMGSGFWMEGNPVILLDISKQGIINTFKSLFNRPIEEFWKPMSQDTLERRYYPKEHWEIHTIEQFS